MKTTPLTEAAALEASRRKVLPAGWIDNALIHEATERLSARSNDMIEVMVAIQDGMGGERLLKDYLTNTPASALKLRHACEAVGALERYQAGTITAEDFPGHLVRIKIGVERRRGYQPRNIIEDYAVSEARVTSLRETAA